MSSEQISFLVFADDWGEHPSSCQHIFRHIVKDYPVVWVNTVGMRLPRLCKADLAKGFRKLKKMLMTTNQKVPQQALPENLSVIQPPMIPYNKGLFRQINRNSVIKAVKQELERRGLNSPILVTTVPNACDYIGAFGEKRVVYYCVDDFANWPGHEKDLILQMEKELIRKTDVLIVVSDILAQRIKKIAKSQKFFLLTHGVDIFRFANPFSIRHEIVKIPRPRIGYTGLIWERLNFQLIEHIINKHSDYSFVFVGKEDISVDFLKKYKNFYYFEPVSFDKVPALLKEFDVLIMPYQLDKGTQSANPLKLKEYLASGKPVIGVPLKEIKKFEPYVVVAETPEEWVKAIQDIISGKLCPPKIPHEELVKEDWSYKAKEFLSFCLS
ncbi:glycosyl transferase, group 1 [Thermodesulfatator indicus DSM 15286]|uniref:Glycosyl transferase, group 1 n=1 Tax=Thermodesulfatator indicus (strain DSM 15286 / JCM 11887 / CIR29812) TaxID=667014 RepID=F8AB75_THEID|nr:glycosyltransferase [Thermodesulfatator indicus]AEH45531.1 glycosyl transferase, group 1 [Thermodesulfatator indicus DSM 15286]